MSERSGESSKTAEEQEREFWQSIIECPHTARLSEIGSELDKVRKYVGEKIIHDKISQAFVSVALSSYHAGVSPLIRIEQTLNLAKGMNNEYAFALAARAYIEVGGRVHKGVRLYRVFDRDRTRLKQFHEGAERLLGKYAQEGKDDPNFFGVNDAKGYNVMSFVESLVDVLPDIESVYSGLSAYVHGGYGEQKGFRIGSWLAHQVGRENPIIAGYARYLEKLRGVVFSDFELILSITEVYRDRYDNNQA